MIPQKRIDRARRKLKAGGYKLRKIERGEDSWMIVDANTNAVVDGAFPCQDGLTLDEVEEWIDANIEQ